MSEANGAVVIPALADGLYHFRDPATDTYHAIDLWEFHVEQKRILAERDAHAGEPYWDVKQFAAWIEQQTRPPDGGVGLQLRLGRANELWHLLECERLKKKEQQEREQLQLVRSLSFLASGQETPHESAA